MLRAPVERWKRKRAVDILLRLTDACEESPTAAGNDPGVKRHSCRVEHGFHLLRETIYYCERGNWPEADVGAVPC
jgi:hypothetical protein